MTRYWHLMEALGTPIKMDGNTASGSCGTFARVLVEVDLAHGLQEAVVIARGEVFFWWILNMRMLLVFAGPVNKLGI